MNGVARKKCFKFLIELRGERFVVRNHKRRAAEVGYHVCHCESFSGAGDAQKCLIPVSGFEQVCQLFDSFGLVSARFIGLVKSKH